MSEEIKELEKKEETEELEEKEDIEDVESQLPSKDNWAVEIDTKDLLSKLAYEKDPNKIKDITYLFNQNISKKNMVRVNSLNNIMDRLTGEVGRRIVFDADSIKNEDLVKFINAIQKAIEGSEKTINGVSEQPTIQINPTTNNNIVVDSLGLTSKESRDKVMDIVNAILKGDLNNNEPEEVEEIEVIEEKSEEE